ncbi:MAG: hypothetical protein LQ346_005225, partial [Caloplaca aetnensis]
RSSPPSFAAAAADTTAAGLAGLPATPAPATASADADADADAAREPTGVKFAADFARGMGFGRAPAAAAAAALVVVPAGRFSALLRRLRYSSATV